VKLSVVRKITREELTGDVPLWVDRLLVPINQFIDLMTIAMRGNITFQDNIAGSIIKLSFAHNTALEFNPNIKGKVLGVQLVDAGNQIVTGFGWTRNASGTISVTIQFSGAPSGTFASTLLVIPEGQ
jgi:hypothetical protein